MEGDYYKGALDRCKALMEKHGDKYMAFYRKVQNLCVLLPPGGQLRIDDYVAASRHDAFCDVVTVFECEQPFGDGDGLVYLSHDRQYVKRSTVCRKPLFNISRKPYPPTRDVEKGQ